MYNNDNTIKTKLMRKSQLIYQYIREHESVSKQDLVIGLNISLPTVTQNLKYLMDLGLIDTSKKIGNTGGRNAVAYTFTEDSRMAIGLYLTANHINAVAVDLSGNVVETEKKRKKFDLDSDLYLQEVGKVVETLKNNASIKDRELLGVGIAVPGIISEDGELVTYGWTLKFTGKTRKQIAKYIPYRNILIHDSKAAGFAEVWIQRDIKNAFYLGLNNSVGGTIIVDSSLYRGDTLKGGEIGHVIAVRKGGKKCYCGRYGCFDTLCRATNLDDYTNGNLDKFFEKLKKHDKHAEELWDTYLDDLAFGVHNIRMLFDGNVILGGYVGAYIEDYIPDLARRVDALNPFEEDKAIDYLVACKYKVESTAAGAAIHYVEEFFENL